MKAAYFTGVKSFEIKETPIPNLPKSWVLVKNKYCGICGTDVHIYHGEPGSADVNPPVILGHEYSGIVEAVGEGVTLVSVGDHVTIDPNIYCGNCSYCRDGKKQMCEKMEAVGVTMDGGFAEYSIVPESQIFTLNKNVPFEYGAMAEPLACCIHGIDLAEIKAGDVVCVIGGGAIGLIMVQLSMLAGASEVILSEPNEFRRQTALELGADLAVNPMDKNYLSEIKSFIGKNGADVVIECVGNNRAVYSAMDIADKGATILLFSVPKIDSLYEMRMFDIFKKELTIKGSFVNPSTHRRAAELINCGKINFEKIITHCYSIDEIANGIEMQMSNESIKVLIKC